MALTKATLIVTRGGGQTENIDVMFNPNEYNLTSSNKYSWQKSPGTNLPVGQFISGNAGTLSMDLFFDSYEKQEDVRQYTHKIASLLDVDRALHTPPICRFFWGSLDFKGVMTQVVQRFTMFLDSGIPVRAVLSVTMNQYMTAEEQKAFTPRESSDRTKERVLKQGEQLWMLAAREYENPGEWRSIARANAIDNPRLPETGRKLVVPPLE